MKRGESCANVYPGSEPQHGVRRKETRTLGGWERREVDSNVKALKQSPTGGENREA